MLMYHPLQHQGERLSHAVGCAFAACLERKQRREKECGVTASFDASRTSFVREGSFRVSSAGQQNDREYIMKQLQDQKKGSVSLQSLSNTKGFLCEKRFLLVSVPLCRTVWKFCNATWKFISSRRNGVTGGASGARRASRHPAPPCSYRAAGAAGLFPWLSTT